MWLRALTGLIFLLVVVSAILFSHYTLSLLFLIIIFGASFELNKLLNSCYQTKLPSLFIATIPTLLFLLFVLLRLNLIYIKYEITVLLVFVFLFLFPFYSSLFFFRNNLIQYLFAAYFSLLYILLPFVLLLLSKQFYGASTPYNYKYFLSFFILIWTNDTFAYLSGKLFGKHKLWESISPNKTIEGFAGGTLFTIGVVFLLQYFELLEDYGMLRLLLIGISVSITATLGDLFQSKLKRMAGVKDSGKIMPGHGGFLDRFDGVLFASPVYFFLTII